MDLWRMLVALTHLRGLSCDQRPLPSRTLISLGEENSFKPFPVNENLVGAA